jgi:hypothetical protein
LDGVIIQTSGNHPERRLTTSACGLEVQAAFNGSFLAAGFRQISTLG